MTIREAQHERPGMRLHSITVRQAWLDEFPPVCQVHVARSLVWSTLVHHGVIGMGWRR